MSKILTRIIALVLIPSLLANPSLALALEGRSSNASLPSSLFSQQALIGRIVSAIFPGKNPQTAHSTVHRLFKSFWKEALAGGDVPDNPYQFDVIRPEYFAENQNDSGGSNEDDEFAKIESIVLHALSETFIIPEEAVQKALRSQGDKTYRLAINTIHMFSDKIPNTLNLVQGIFNRFDRTSPISAAISALFEAARVIPWSAPPTYDPDRPGDRVHFIYATHDSKEQFQEIEPVLTAILSSPAAAHSQKIHILLEGDLVQPEDLFKYGPTLLLKELEESSATDEMRERIIELIGIFFRGGLVSIAPNDEAINAVLATLDDPFYEPVYFKIFENIARLKPWYRLRYHLKNPERFDNALVASLKAARSQKRNIVRHMEITPLLAQKASLRADLLSLRSGTTWDMLLRWLSDVLRFRRTALLDQVRVIKKAEPTSTIIVIRGSNHRQDHRDLVEKDGYSVWVHSYPEKYFESSDYKLLTRFLESPGSVAADEIRHFQDWRVVEKIVDEILEPIVPHHVEREIAVNHIVLEGQKAGLQPEQVVDSFEQLADAATLEAGFEHPIISRLETPPTNSSEGGSILKNIPPIASVLISAVTLGSLAYTVYYTRAAQELSIFGWPNLLVGSILGLVYRFLPSRFIQALENSPAKAIQFLRAA